MNPLIPPDVDLRGMPWMPLDTVRLIDSDLFALSTGDEFKAAVALWCKSWTQVPAASLPNDDRILAHLSGTASRWKRVKAMCMRGWVLCEDNRYYHAVIAEKALEAWKEREEFQDRQENETTRLQNFRAEHKALRQALRSHGVVLPFDTKIDVLRSRLAELQAETPETQTETQTFQEQKRQQRTCNAPAMAKTGTGTGTGIKDQEQGGKPPLSSAGADDYAPPDESNGQRVPACPHGQILALFAEKLPELPQPLRSLWAESKNAEALRSRWRWVLSANHESGSRKGQRLAESVDDGIAWFGRFFEYVRRSPLLMGEKGDWHADLGWLVRKANFEKVIQGNYEEDAA